jgi:hypothetical protein
MFIFGFVITPNKKILEKLGLDKGRRTRIRCPKCQWEPSRNDSWCCAPGCGHVWNTFETHGLCPGCNKQWTHTACLRCDAWSLHDDWYEEVDE